MHTLKEISDPKQEPLKCFQSMSFGQMCRTDAPDFVWAPLLSEAKSNRSKKSYLESQIWFRHGWAPARTLLQTTLFFNKWKMKYLFHLYLELSVALNTCWMTQNSKRWWYHILRPEGREVELQKLQSCHRNRTQKSLDNISKQMDNMHYSVWHLLFH